MSLLLAVDQGTTGTTSLVMDKDGRTLGRAGQEFPQHFPSPGWVEHEPEEIWETIERTAAEALRLAGARGDQIAAVGITNQRETTLLWERDGGRCVHRAIVWQDRRTEEHCQTLRAQGRQDQVRAVTGLVIDPYFSGTKLRWLLEHVPDARARADQGKLAFGTIDSWMIFRMSGGEAHVTDVTNASRTMLFGLESLTWDASMLSMLEIPKAVLPTPKPSAGVFARTKGFSPLPDGVPIAGVAGDQQAALFGQACFEVGQSKCTYGTGAFVLTNIGRLPKVSRSGLVTTVACQIGERVTYAFEGSSFIAGAAVQWLRDGLGIIARASDIEALALSVPDTGGVAFVPALAGLGAPYWDANARGVITGLTRGTTKAHIARATLEGMAFQVSDLLAAMSDDMGAPVASMRVDGGAAANNLLMQMQADFAGITVERPTELESTARGAAMLAGIGAGVFSSPEDAARMTKLDRTFQPAIAAADRGAALSRWKDAVKRSRSTAS